MNPVSPASAEAVRNIRGLCDGAPFTAALLRAAQPEPVLSIAEWAEQRRIVAAESGSPKPGAWSNDTTPMGVEIMDCLDAEHPSRTVTLQIGAQMIKSELILNWIGATIDVDPAPMMLVLPSINEVRTWNATKFEPTRQATPSIRKKVLAVVERAATGSTTNFKAFPGGSLIVATASSSKELQARSVKRAALDELEEFPDDVGGRGDPVDQVVTRADAHVDAKFLLASTPGELPACRITSYLGKSDRRELYCACPECGERQTLDFDRLTIDRDIIGLFCLGCGAFLTEAHRPALIASQRDGWIKCYPGEDGNPAPPDHYPAEDHARWRSRTSNGRQPGFWANQMHSPFKPWAVLYREGQEAAAGSVEKRKTFRQQKLALAWDPSIDAPDHEQLYAARGAHVERGIIPAWAWLITGAADVQNNRIEWAAYAWGPDKSGARFDYGICEGDTLTDAPWIELADVIGRRWPGAACVPLGFDAFCIDTGGGSGRTARTYGFCQRSPKIRAIKGSSDHRAMPYAQGAIQKLKNKATGKYAQARVDFIGGHGNKHIVMAMLHRSVDAEGEGERLPVGLYFTADTPEEHFRQLTAEVFKLPRTKRAGAVGFWEKLAGRANEQLDLAVYNYGLAWDQGIDRWDAERWAALMAKRAKPAEDAPLLDIAQIESAPAEEIRGPRSGPFTEEGSPLAPAEDAPPPAIELLSGEEELGDGGPTDAAIPASESGSADIPPPARIVADGKPPAAKLAANPGLGAAPGDRPDWAQRMIALNRKNRTAED